MKRLAVIHFRDRYVSAIIVSGRRGEWARLADGLVLFPGAFDEDDIFELPEDLTEADTIALALNNLAK